MAILVHVPIAVADLDKTKWAWAPFIDDAAKASKQDIAQVLTQIYEGDVHLHLAWDDQEKKAYALAGSRIILQGSDRVGRIVWLAGFNRERWLTLCPAFEQYHKEHLGCSQMQALIRRGWLSDLKSQGYRVTRLLVEKRL